MFRSLLIILTLALTAHAKQWPFSGELGQKTYLTSSYGESRGMRYHTGWDYSTLQREGLVLRAPEDGKVVRVKVSPWGYGKVIYFQGQSSGKIYVLAHLSGFSFGEIIQTKLKKLQRNTLNWKVPHETLEFKKGEILAYSGSSGIGSPHLHLEVRPQVGQTQNPHPYAQHFDSLAPVLTSIAMMHSQENSFWNLDQLSSINDSAETMILTKTSDDYYLKDRVGQALALKIVDYSQTYGENPMSIAELKLSCQGEVYFQKSYQTLTFGKHPIMLDHLWGRDDSIPGDWHYIDFSSNWATKPDLQKCLKEHPLKIYIADANQNSLVKNIYFESSHQEAIPPSQTLRPYIGNQPWSHFTLLQNYYPNPNSTSRIVDSLILKVNASKIKAEKPWGKFDITLEKQAIKPPQIALFKNTDQESHVIYEWHPKGTPTDSKNSNYCYIKPQGQGWGLYYQAESSLDWIYYSHQKPEGKYQCVRVNELRDTRFLQDTLPPVIENPRWQQYTRDGKEQQLLTLDMKDLSSFTSSNQIKAFIKDSKEFIPLEWDHEDEIITLRLDSLTSRHFKDQTLLIQAKDDMGLITKIEVQLPLK